MDYNKEELVDMIFILGESLKYCFLASRLYAQRYPERRHPDRRSLQNLLERFTQTGHTEYTKSVRNRSVRTEENELAVLLQVTENPLTSQKAIGDAVGVTHFKREPFIKNFSGDFDLRIDFCNWAQGKIRENFYFFNSVLFSDEATFHKNGFVNRHNFHYYSDHNPRIFRQIDRQHRWSIN
ncbi:hypothetical protein NQ315_012027, partial [Exocentrus adspersus]